MNFYSHIKFNSEGKITDKKLLKVHLKNVQKNISELLSDTVSFEKTSKEELRKIATLIGALHDLGKYVPDFQAYLLQKQNYDKELKNHARFGAFVVFAYLLNYSFETAFFAYYIVKNHHANLSNFIKDILFDEIKTEDIIKIFLKQREKLLPFILQIESELKIIGLDEHIATPFDYSDLSFRKFRKKARKISNNENCENYFFINYLFSLLIEADKLDASNNKIYKRKSIPTNTVTKFVNSLFSVPDKTKNEIRAVAVDFAQKIDYSKNKIYTLTAPTGAGKTFTALDFAITLRDRIARETGEIPQIIYSLPFVNIIEQSAKIYRDVLRDKAKVLAHYQFSSYDVDDNLSYEKKLMLLETWQADVIITSFVQLAETMISNKNKMLKKFSHFANAIVILDEVQAIEMNKLPLIGAVISLMSKFLNTKFLLMTATKPYIFETAKKITKENINALPVLTKYEKYFSDLSRTQIVPLNENEIDEEGFIEIFKHENPKRKSALIVVNTVARSLCVYEKLKDFLTANDWNNPLFYLSTNILPAHKLKKIEEIKKALENGISPILVATQTVEAGVDLDFDLGFRDIAPLDSIIQVAGRINRYGKRGSHKSLFVVDFNDCQKVYGTIAKSLTEKILENKSQIHEEEYLKIIDEYFQEISRKSAPDYSEKILNAICTLNYSNEEENSISTFKMIEEVSFYHDVYVEYDETATSALNIFRDYLSGKTTKEEFMKSKSAFYSYIVKIPKNQLNETVGLNYVIEGTEIILIDKDMITDYYDEASGFKRKTCEEDYSMEII